MPGWRLQAGAFAIVALAGCSRGAAPPREPGRVVTSLAEIAGPWDIERFGVDRPSRVQDGIRHAYVDIGPDGLSYTIECNFSANSGHVDGDGILLAEDNGMRIQTVMSCGREGDARDARFFSFFSSRPKVTWLEGGRIRMANGPTELILERPEMRRLANIPSPREIAGRWVPQMATRLLAANGHQGWGFQQPGVVTIGSDSLFFSGCGGVTYGFRYTSEGRMITAARRPVGHCDGDQPADLFLQVLAHGPLVERTAEGGLALTAGNLVISLKRDAAERQLRQNPPPLPRKAAPMPPLSSMRDSVSRPRL